MANATNAVGLWPGSLAGGLGFKNLHEKTSKHLKSLVVPTILGAITGSVLLLLTSQRAFDIIIPFLIALAAILLLLQKRVKALLLGEHAAAPMAVGMLVQFLVALYGGYFGAGMGIMMLAAFALYMEGNTHELNSIKNWLGLIINFTASIVFIAKGFVELWPAVVMACGSIVGGYSAARISQRFDPSKLRLIIAIYGLGMAAYFAYRAFAK